ncbi:MAG: tRNA adenosine(34) deaminase TadA [Alphaproteobacteria bacterium]
MGDVCAQPELRDVFYMELALAEAEAAAARGEVPVGAVVVCGERVVGRGFNCREERQSPLSHAELVAIEEAAGSLHSWRLSECEIYVTLEPCVMCVGAILQARIARLVFGCLDAKAGAVESLYKLCEDARFNHRLPVRSGVLAERCALLLEDFFTKLRTRKKQLRTAERWPSPVEGA